jgi:diaminopimelate epimerase
MTEFAKLHALGNDFLVVQLPEAEGYRVSLPALSRAMCDRHAGIGADGVVFYHPTTGDTEADFSVLIFNSDGSRAEMSGNGIRCLAAHLFDAGIVRSGPVRLRSVAGIRSLCLKEAHGSEYLFEGMMGHPITEPSRVPTTLGDGKSPVVDQLFSVAGESLRVTVSSMGNPHCTTFVDVVAEVAVDRLGPLIEKSGFFPNGANVEFVQVLDHHTLRVRFWERGAGPTLSSGTGSSAAAFAGILNGLVASPVRVLTDLGALEVAWEPGSELRLTGPATAICKGSYAGCEAPTVQ